jgi:ribonuclease P protein component
MSTIRSSKEIDFVFRSGRRAATPLVTILMTDTPHGRDPGGRVAFIAGKRLGNAVLRNRAKRLLRAALRQAGGPWPGHDVALIAQRRLLDVTSDQVAGDIRSLMKRVETFS